MTIPRPAIVFSYDIMALHQAWTAGDTAAVSQLVIVVYREPRHQIAAQLRGCGGRLQLEGTRRGISGPARHPRQTLPGEPTHDA